MAQQVALDDLGIRKMGAFDFLVPLRGIDQRLRPIQRLK